MNRSYQQEVPVDLHDDLHVARQQVLQQRDRPAFQRLRQHGVVRIGARRHRDTERL